MPEFSLCFAKLGHCGALCIDIVWIKSFCSAAAVVICEAHVAIWPGPDERKITPAAAKVRP